MFGWIETALLGLFAIAVAALAGFLHARRGIRRIAYLPWDYLLIAAAFVLLVAVAHGIDLWRAGWPLPWQGGPGQ